MRSTILGTGHRNRSQPRFRRLPSQPPVDQSASAASSELRAHIERVLTAHYELDSEIGRGGMGVVYRARDRRLKRHIAIKVLPPELARSEERRVGKECRYRWGGEPSMKRNTKEMQVMT